mgnify:CR=1 FL=1
MRAIRLLVWLAGGALSATMIAGAVIGPWPPADKAAITYGLAFVAISIGVIVWELRPESRTGILLTAFPFTALLADLRVVFSGSTLAVTVGYATQWLPAPVFAHLDHAGRLLVLHRHRRPADSTQPTDDELWLADADHRR